MQRLCPDGADVQAQQTAWQERYGRWHGNNLETEGVLDAYDGTHVYVHKSHPAIELILNYATDGMNTDMCLFECLCRITRDTFHKCCQLLRSEILDHWVLTHTSPEMVETLKEKGVTLRGQFTLTRLAGTSEYDTMATWRPMMRQLSRWSQEIHQAEYWQRKKSSCDDNTTIIRGLAL